MTCFEILFGKTWQIQIYSLFCILLTVAVVILARDFKGNANKLSKIFV
jgi:hypothetical protein